MIVKKSIPFALACCALLASGCASKGDMAHLDERARFMEREVLAARTETAVNSDNIHDLDLRIEYLEREAAARGVKVPPRKTAQGPLPANVPNLPSSTAPSPVQAQPAKALPTPKEKQPSKPVVDTPAKNIAPKTEVLPLVPGLSPTQQASSQPGSMPPQNESSDTSAAPGFLPLASSPSPGPVPRVSESTPATPAPPASPPPVTPARTEKNAYDAALQLYRTGRFPQSEAAFQAFLEVYPHSALVPNALYWKGETLYSRGTFTDAIFAFKDVQTRFPRHPKTPDSLLKTAMSYAKLGDQGNAALHLTVLFEDWPQSEAAKRARSMGLKP